LPTFLVRNITMSLRCNTVRTMRPYAIWVLFYEELNSDVQEQPRRSWKKFICATESCHMRKSESSPETVEAINGSYRPTHDRQPVKRWQRCHVMVSMNALN